MADPLAKVEAEILELKDRIKQLEGKGDELSRQERLALQQQLASLRQEKVLLMQSQASGGRSTGNVLGIAPPQDDMDTLLADLKADLKAINDKLAPYQAVLQPVQRWHTRIFNTAKDAKKEL